MALKSSKTLGWILTAVGIAIALFSNKIVFPGLEMLLGIETIVGKESVSYFPDECDYLFTNPGAMVKWVASVASIGLLIAVAGVIVLLREKKRSQNGGSATAADPAGCGSAKHWRWGADMKPNTKRRLITFGIMMAAIGLAYVAIPAPLGGYWHTGYSDCMCDSNNLLKFEDGKAFRWAAGHDIIKEDFGTYERHGYWYRWQHKNEIIWIKPGWFHMKIRSQQYMLFSGERELRSDYIEEVITHKKKEPDKPEASSGK